MKKSIKRYLLVSLLAFCLVACSSKPNDCEITVDGDCIIHSPDEAILRQQPLNPFPNLTAKPIYWQDNGIDRYPTLINLPYIYIKKSDGLWIRYKNFPDMDFFIGFTTPEGYLYQEIDNPTSVPANIRKYARAMNLFDMKTGGILYQQPVYTIQIAYWSEFDTDYDDTFYPTEFYNLGEKLQLLQTKVADFPDNKEEVWHEAKMDNQKNIPFTGNKVYPPLNFSQIFNWRFKDNIEQTIRFNEDSKSHFWVIGGSAYNVVVEQLAEAKYQYCDKKRNAEINIHVIKNAPFAIPENYDSYNHFQLKAGYRLQDVASYEFQDRLFVIKQPDYKTEKTKEEWQYELKLLDKNNNVINEICGGENRLPKEP